MIAGLMLVPASASAATYVVNTTEDFTPETGCNDPGECNLRKAIQQANGDGEDSTIEFAVSGTLELGSELPAITAKVTIDGTGVLGLPAIELDGSGLNPSADGIVLAEGLASGSKIEGLAIGGFDRGVEIWGDDQSLCADYIGTDLSGSVANPNVVGVEMVEAASVLPEENEIGSGCTVGNVISGNEGDGVTDAGYKTQIAQNIIGMGANGEALPNGGNGIRATEIASLTWIAENTIAHNGGAGVQIASGQSLIGVVGNSIFANGGLGIEILADDEVPAPVLTGASSAAGSTTVSGTLSGAAPETTYALDFYANSSCDPSGSGEGETFIGEASPPLPTDAAGGLSFTATGLDELPAGQTVITATATELIPESYEQVSEFSQCFNVPAPPGPPPPGPPAATAAVTPGLEPVNGELLVAAPQSGTIKVKVPGQNKFKTLQAGEEIPVGSIVDATRGKVTLTSINKAGETQTAVFYGGKFLVAQKEGSGLVVLKLRGGNFSSCKGAGKSGATASGKSGRKLWGSGKGKFRTEGSYGSATVRGTVWLTEDRCSGTFFKTKKGVVSVRDFVSGTNFSLPAGKSYLAKKEG